MNIHTAPAYTIGKTKKKTIDQLTGFQDSSPGPMYNTQGLGVKHKSVSHLIGKSNRGELNHFIEKTPSPFDYNPEKKENNKVQYSIPKYSPTEQPNNNPDPSWYNPEHFVVKPKALNYSIGTKYPSIMDDIQPNPGPGYYETVKTTSKTKTNTKKQFGTASRFSQPKINIPGPGDYQVTHRNGLINNKGTMEKSPRVIHESSSTPGPSDYYKKSCFQEKVDAKIGKTLSGRLQGCIEENPITKDAFNNYFKTKKGEDAMNFDSGQKYSIGKAQRTTFADNKLPGPTDYITDKFIPKTNYHSTIPNSYRHQYNDTIENPGPGAYQIPPASQVKYSIPRSKSMPFVIANPGVGRYQVTKDIDEIKTGISMAKSKRTDFVSRNGVGVGEYNIVRKSQGNISIPKAERFPKQESNKPGPGDYHIHPTLANLHFYKNKV